MEKEKIGIGIIICHRYHTCGGGKCFRAIRERTGAFRRYPEDTEVEVVGYGTCGGCPGGNVEYVPQEMIRNGAQVIHLATGLIVGYPPCPRIDFFRRFIEERYGVPVVPGTHPVPEKYYLIHAALGTWKGEKWSELLAPALDDAETRLAYD
jgi:predicted metal-binding protein